MKNIPTHLQEINYRESTQTPDRDLVTSPEQHVTVKANAFRPHHQAAGPFHLRGSPMATFDVRNIKTVLKRTTAKALSMHTSPEPVLLRNKEHNQAKML
ncbi:hypothetical protein EVAR_51115_1 [Eumeta japonica]|uniref:Uncharacterized protein n=1 Tax=Eumeta variegata TaxID=151549 RepID=A0A4C1Y8G7_EUMVA|nr:hypothetical protein EVAR_51115_1 [Eumeta japonica]